MSYHKLGMAYEKDILEQFQNLHEIHEKVIGVDMSGELPEQELLFRYIHKDAKVLEFGGNIGRSSIVISKLLENPQHHVVLESNPDIAKELLKNRNQNHCGFHVVNAALSETPIIQNDWNTKPAPPHSTLPEGWKSVPTITYKELVRRYPIRFDTLVADCEGCLVPIFKSYPFLLDNVHTIVIENDAQYSSTQSNDYIQNFIRKHGFRSVECRAYNEEMPCFFQVWIR